MQFHYNAEKKNFRLKKNRLDLNIIFWCVKLAVLSISLGKICTIVAGKKIKKCNKALAISKSENSHSRYFWLKLLHTGQDTFDWWPAELQKNTHTIKGTSKVGYMKNVLTPALHLPEKAKLQTFLPRQVLVTMQNSMLTVLLFCLEWYTISNGMRDDS